MSALTVGQVGRVFAMVTATKSGTSLWKFAGVAGTGHRLGGATLASSRKSPSHYEVGCQLVTDRNESYAPRACLTPDVPNCIGGHASPGRGRRRVSASRLDCCQSSRLRPTRGVMTHLGWRPERGNSVSVTRLLNAPVNARTEPWPPRVTGSAVRRNRGPCRCSPIWSQL